jgi:hypothetical protein
MATENKISCWNLLPEKRKGPEEKYLILHNYSSDYVKNMQKNKGEIDYAEPYNDFIVNWKDVKQVKEVFCHKEECPLGNKRFEEDLAYKRKLIKEDTVLFRCAKPELIQRMCMDISEKEKRYIEELYEQVRKKPEIKK